MVGLLFLSLAASASYSNSVLSAVRGRVYFRLPGASAQDYSVFSIYWLVLGLPVLMLVVGLCFRPFRAALTSAWRKRGTAAALVMTLVVLGFSLIPWEPKIENPAYGASRIVLCLILGSVGFVWFVAGIYHRLGFLETATRGCYNWLMSLDRRVFLLLAAGFTFVVANAVSWLVFFHLPQVADSISQVFQARIFASGRLWLPAPQFPDFFDYTHIINVAGSTGHPASGFAASDWPGPLGRWYSQYPFLHPLLLTLGVLLGAPWLVNPLLGALTVVAVYYLGCEIYDERSGRLGALLACASPFIFNMSGEFMNHASALLLATLFMLFWFRAFVPSAGKAERRTWRSALLAGLFIGLVADIRPYTAAALALPFAVYSLVRAVARPRLYLGRLLALALAGAAAAGLVLIYNALTNGHPLLFGYVVKYGAGHEIGFGHSAWGQSHTPWRGLVNVGHDLNMLNRFLFEWPVPSLAVVLLVFLTGKASKPDWLLLAAFVGLPVAYFFYWFHQACFGPRFLYEASACLVLLTVRSGQSLGLLLRRVFGRDASDRSAAGLVARVLPLLLFWMLTVNLPPLLRSYRNPASVNYQPVARARQAKLENALVFCNDFGNGFTANPLDRNGPVVYARDYGRLNSALTLAYPGRDYYYANRDTLRRLVGLDYPQSELRQILDAMAQALADTVIAPYRTLLWPFRDIPPAGVDPEFVSLHLADYRELSRELFTGRRELDDYLPALACWLVKDKREHLAVFSFMDELQNYIAEPYKFTLVYVNEDQTAAYYDIRRTTGGELLDEEQPDH